MVVLAMLDTDMVLELTDILVLDITARDLLMLILNFSMEDMDMVLVSDMLVLDIEVLDMLDTDMALELTDTLDLDITARDPLMLSLKPRLMLDFFMEDMDMDLVLDMLV